MCACERVCVSVRTRVCCAKTSVELSNFPPAARSRPEESGNEAVRAAHLRHAVTGRRQPEVVSHVTHPVEHGLEATPEEPRHAVQKPVTGTQGGLTEQSTKSQTATWAVLVTRRR